MPCGRMRNRLLYGAELEQAQPPFGVSGHLAFAERHGFMPRRKEQDIRVLGSGVVWKLQPLPVFVEGRGFGRAEQSHNDVGL